MTTEVPKTDATLELLVTPLTLGGFKGAFYAAHRRAPTEQEIFDAGTRAGLRRAADGEKPKGGEWPMLSPRHLEALVLAYNEGFSKAYDRRELPNPFSEQASQHAACEAGKRDGRKLRDEDDATKITARHQLLISKKWITDLVDELVKDCDRAVRQATDPIDIPREYDTCFGRIVQDAIRKITVHTA